jgi:hypothetical protein
MTRHDTIDEWIPLIHQLTPQMSTTREPSDHRRRKPERTHAHVDIGDTSGLVNEFVFDMI